MQISKTRTRRAALKVLAVLSAAAVLVPGAVAEMAVGTSQTGIVASAASAVATKLKVLDENGKDLGDNAVFYVDNNRANKDNITSRKFTVVASNDNGAAVEDQIRCFYEGDSDGEKYSSYSMKKPGELEVTVNGYDGEGASRKAGTSHIYFTTAGGEVYRSVTIVTLEPATDMKVFWVTNKGKTELKDKDNNPIISASIMTIANHKYQFDAERIPSSSTDEVEWAVYDGYYDGTSTGKTTSKAEITQTGLFTPKTNGEVTIVTKYKKTSTSKKEKSFTTRKVDGEDADVQSVPKFLHVTIVKENPATGLAIKNAPSAMEVGDKMKLAFESDAAYSGAGYESGATDVFTWSTSNSKVVTVDDEGNIQAVGKGDAKITITAENENVHAEVDIKVLTKAQSIKITGTPSTKVDGQTVLTAKMNPDTADEEIIWSSSNTSVATVESLVNGKFTNSQTAAVTGVKVGTAVITAKAKNSGVEAKITVNVVKKTESAEISVTYAKDDNIVNVYNGSVVEVFDQNNITFTGALVALDGSTPDDTMVWEVLGNGANNGDYVTIVSETATALTLKGFARGSVQVKVSSKNNPTISKLFDLNVLKRATSFTIVDAVARDTSYKKNLNVGSTLSLDGDLKISTNQPYDHDDRVAHWKSNNTAVAQVTDDGFVKIVGNGKAVLTATAESGKTATTTLVGFTTSSVVLKGSKLVTKTDGSLPDLTITLAKNTMTATETLSATVYNESDTAVSGVNLEWSSSDENIATVDSTGKVTGHALGDCNITVKSGNKTDVCHVSVEYALGSATVIYGSATYDPTLQVYRPSVSVAYSYTETDILGHSTTVNVSLVEGKDYEVTYTDNNTVGEYVTIEVIGMGKYNSKVTKKIQITARPVSDPEVIVRNIPDQELTMDNKTTGVKPEVVVYYKGYKLAEGTDYTLTYATTNKKPGTSNVKITGKGNYNGNTTVSFDIFCKHGDKTITKTIKEATCSEEGEAQYKCNICGTTFTAAIPKSDHTWKTVTNASGKTIKVCEVCGSTDLSNDSIISATNVKLNTDVKMTGKASSGSSPYKYAFYYKKASASSWTTIGTAFGSATTGTFKPAADGEYIAKVSVKDSEGTVVSKEFTVVCTGALKNNSTISAQTVDVNNNVVMSGSASGGTAPYKYGYYCKKSTDSTWTKLSETNGSVYVSDTSYTFTPKAAGTYNLKINVKDSEGTIVQKEFEVTANGSPLANNSTISAASVAVNSAVTITAKATGGSTPYKYGYYYKKSTDSTWTKLSNSNGSVYVTNTSYQFKPTTAGTYNIKVNVKDDSGAIASKELQVKATGADLINSSTVSSTSVAVNSAVTITAKASGGSSSYKYGYYYKKSTDSTWTKLSNSNGSVYVTNTSYKFTPTAAGTYNLKVNVKDTAGTVASKEFTVKATGGTALTNNSKISATSVTANTTVTLTGVGAGGTSPYKYAYYYKKSTDSSWTKAYVTSSGSAYTKYDSVTFKPTSAGTYDVRINVKDQYGEGQVVSKEFTLTVKASSASLTNSSTVSSTSVSANTPVTLNGKASGGTSPYLYAYYYKKASATSWEKLMVIDGSAYSSNTSCKYTPKAAGTYSLRINVKDNSGSVVSRDFTLTVK